MAVEKLADTPSTVNSRPRHVPADLLWALAELLLGFRGQSGKPQTCQRPVQGEGRHGN